MQMSEPEGMNPHYPVNNGVWNRPQRDIPAGLFKTPRAFDYSDVAGSKPKPEIDLSMPPRPSNVTIPNAGKLLFQNPRNLDKSVDSARLKYSYIPNNREPTPVDKNPFYRTGIKSMKYVPTTVPQIDLSKPARPPREIMQYESPRIFEQPREPRVIEESRPKQYVNTNIAARPVNPVIPNSARVVFKDPIDPANKYDDVPGTHSSVHIDMKRAVRDNFYRQEPSTKRKLFETEARDIFKIPEGQRKPRPPTHHDNNEPIGPMRPKLFVAPRPTNKYEDLPGTHPDHFRQGQSIRIIGDPFRETFNMNE